MQVLTMFTKYHCMQLNCMIRKLISPVTEAFTEMTFIEFEVILIL